MPPILTPPKIEVQTKYRLSESQIAAIQRMKSQGFTHAKIELEAQLNRSYGENYEDCSDCDEGRMDCPYCDGIGVAEDTTHSPNGRTLYLTAVCDDCEGDGLITCSTCDGDGRSETDFDWSNEENCENYILSYVSLAARAALVYSRFYDDGSVDSEFTFTVAMDDLHLAVEYLDAFNALARENGGGMDTDGAGMHLSVLTSGTYPTSQQLDPDKIENFKTEVQKLLPALYFVASPDHASRSLEYRSPKIDEDKHNGYPAICTHGDTALEYRIFETCYQRPEALLENYEVIANTLKYYSSRHLNLTTTTVGGQNLRYTRGLARFYDSPERLEALNQGLPFVKPKDKTIHQLKRERNFKLDQRKFIKEGKIKRHEAQTKYQQLVKEIEFGNVNAYERLRHEQQCVREESVINPSVAERYSRLIDLDLSDLAATTRYLIDYNYVRSVPSFDEWYATRN